MEYRGKAPLFLLVVSFSLLLTTGIAVAQDTNQSVRSKVTAEGQTSGVEHEETPTEPLTMNETDGMGRHTMQMLVKSLIKNILHHSLSGTSVEPNSTPAHMLMTVKGNWRLMVHGVIWLNELQQSGPRGADKFFSTNWFMPMAQRNVGPGQLTVRTMLSLEPATITTRRYPELFEQGETAYGKPIVDGQHPHDFLMELAALYDLKIGENALLSFYAAPVGDPAMGPTAYPHRISGSENPSAPLGHHLEDSTHISNDVITAGFTYKKLRLEASGFHGRGPDEHRWDIDSGNIDSWSVRFTVNPAQHWSMQYSLGHLTSPDALYPAEDVRRMTASVMYNRPLARGNWATTLIWGRNQALGHRQIFNGYLAESTLRFGRQSVWSRIENADRTNELLLGENPLPPDFEEHFAARVQAYSFGYDHEIGNTPHLSIALGGQLTFYGKPSFLDPIYGNHPLGGLVFLRLRPVSVQR